MESIKEALKARANAYAPYSNFKVGAAILHKNGTYIHGANIENGSYGLSNCAERSALFSYFSLGNKKEDIVSITVVADTQKGVSPCGACRQVMYELLPDDAKIILSNLNGDNVIYTKEELLPYPFSL